MHAAMTSAMHGCLMHVATWMKKFGCTWLNEFSKLYGVHVAKAYIIIRCN